MKTVWTAQELREAYAKRNSKQFVVKTSDGRFYDLSDRLLAKMQDHYAIYESDHEVVVSRASSPPVRRVDGVPTGEIYHS